MSSRASLSKPKKRPALRAAFVVTASVGALAAGCNDDLITNPPEPPDPPGPCDETPQQGGSCTTGDACIIGSSNGCDDKRADCVDGEWDITFVSTCNPPPPTCSPSDPCGPNEYCVYDDGLCGTGEPGECFTIPNACSDAPPTLDAACGCNGATANDIFGACGFALDGFDTWSPLAAPCAEVQTFACGSQTCDVGESCAQVLGPMGTQSNCVPLEPGCAFTDPCGPSCVGEIGLGCTCAVDGYGHPTVTCSG